MKPVRVPANTHTVILRPLTGRGSDVIFHAVADDDDPVSGHVEEYRHTFFGSKSTLHPLRAENRFRLSLIHSGYRLAVIPERDVEIRFLTSHFQVKDAVRWAVIILGGAIGLSVLMNLFGLGTSPVE